ncbi:short-chain dehydrogenase [Xylogone sp. PMI_703]|nr:short-chain dehydrogenase [Xylogone sp. PMI_703]
MTTFPEFGEETTGTAVADAFSKEIQGKNVLIVGVSPNSLGESMALAIARHSPALLILASRTKEKIEEVISKIKDLGYTSQIKSVTVNLSDQDSIRQTAKEINSLTTKLNIVINNAAVNVQDHQFTKEGIELHFGTNHVGLFLLTNLLMENIKNAAKTAPKGSTRIINVTSAGHRLSAIRFSDYNFKLPYEEVPESERPPVGLPAMFYNYKDPYSPFLAYGQCKTANILFSLYLNEHLQSEGILSYSTHPGSIWTGLARNLDEEAQKTIRATGKNWKTQDQGCATTLVAAFDPALNSLSDPANNYMSDCQLAQAAEHATKQEAAERLWKLSEELVGEQFNL